MLTGPHPIAMRDVLIASTDVIDYRYLGSDATVCRRPDDSASEGLRDYIAVPVVRRVFLQSRAIVVGVLKQVVGVKAPGAVLIPPDARSIRGRKSVGDGPKRGALERPRLPVVVGDVDRLVTGADRHRTIGFAGNKHRDRIRRGRRKGRPRHPVGRTAKAAEVVTPVPIDRVVGAQVLAGAGPRCAVVARYRASVRAPEEQMAIGYADSRQPYPGHFGRQGDRR